jgi:hypothetical protein
MHTDVCAHHALLVTRKKIMSVPSRLLVSASITTPMLHFTNNVTLHKQCHTPQTINMMAVKDS